MTTRVSLRRGVRQGCPLSPMLYIYVLSLEPLAASIRCNPRICGIPISDPVRDRIVVTCYADDLTCFVTTSESFQALGDELQVYQAASGAMLNYQKSIGLTLGTWSSQMTRPLPIQWTTESVKVLGLVYTPSYYDTVVQNWALVLQKFHATLSKWDLSFFGRAQQARRKLLCMH